MSKKLVRIGFYWIMHYSTYTDKAYFITIYLATHILVSCYYVLCGGVCILSRCILKRVLFFEILSQDIYNIMCAGCKYWFLYYVGGLDTYLDKSAICVKNWKRGKSN